MTADSYSARVGLIKQFTGNNNNNWGDIFNSAFTDLLDRVLYGVDVHAVTGGTLDYSGGTLPPSGPNPVAGGTQIFTGNLTSTQTVILPALGGKWTFFNQTTGAFSLLIKLPAQATPIQIPAGKFVDVYADGTGCYRRDRADIGRAVFFAGGSPPGGYLQMSGQSLLRSDYPDLFAAIGTIYGAVDGTHFTLPQLQDTGRYIRSTTASLTLGTAQSNQNAAHGHTVTGNPGLGSLGTDVQGAHVHGATVNDPQHHHSYTVVFTTTQFPGSGGPSAFVTTTSSNTGDSSTGISVTITSAGAHNHNITGTPGVGTLATASSGGTEARPESIAMVACILY